MNNDYITVTQLTKYIKFKIDNDAHLSKVYLKGEISNFKAHTRGHFYFTIKDENSRINAVMFSTYAKDVKFDIQDGMKVLVTGKISVYEATGGYQIYVDSIQEDGLGNLYVAFEQLKKKLQEEGLFNEDHKKTIPKIPNKIGIITAPTGAAIKDILSTLKRRWPLAETILFPSLVQGAEAATDIVKNIELSKQYDLDVLIVGRGGGSIEDLWCFNEEIVARAIYNLNTPVISAVGHEIDFTISDFVADLRAPTPTGAAEMAVPDIKDITKLLSQIEIRLLNSTANIMNINKEALNKLQNAYVLKNPLAIYEIKGQKFDNLFDRLVNSFNNKITNTKNKIELIDNRLINSINIEMTTDKNDFHKLLSKLEVLNPLLTIKRGYSIVRKDDKVISSAKDLKKKDNLELELKDGKVNVEVL